MFPAIFNSLCLFITRILASYQEEITTTCTIAGSFLGLTTGAVAGAYTVLPKEQFDAAWMRGWRSGEENNADMKRQIKKIENTNFDHRQINKLPLEDIRAVMKQYTIETS